MRPVTIIEFRAQTEENLRLHVEDRADRAVLRKLVAEQVSVSQQQHEELVKLRTDREWIEKGIGRIEAELIAMRKERLLRR